jgi:hypothetical protein
MRPAASGEEAIPLPGDPGRYHTLDDVIATTKHRRQNH